jgi:Rab GDP dissociation inhibitor
MADAAGGEKTVEVGGKSYKPLADGQYDVIVMGTGTTECVLSGLFAVGKKRVLVVDRNNFYGAECASLNLTNLFRKFRDRKPTEEEFAKLGSNRDFNVDLIPKFLMSCGNLVKILLRTKVTAYLGFKVVDGSFVMKGQGKGKPGKLAKVPSTGAEALKTPLVGMIQKFQLRAFFSFLGKVTEETPVVDKVDTRTATMAEVYKKFSLDDNSQSFIGHAMALQDSEAYLDQPALPTILACRLYGFSVERHGSSPYLYPIYGLGGLPEGFSRLCAVHGGTFMLNQDIDEVIFDETGQAVGVRAGDQAAAAPVIIGEASYFPKEKVSQVGTVVRSICFLKHPIRDTNDANSAQIIIPASQVAEAGYPPRKFDVYISCVSFDHKVAPDGMYIAIVSTNVETAEPLKEVQVGIDLLGDIIDRFDAVSPVFAPVTDGKEDKCFITTGYDGSSHFESCSNDIQRMYQNITDEPLDLSIKADLESEDS